MNRFTRYTGWAVCLFIVLSFVGFPVGLSTAKASAQVTDPNMTVINVLCNAQLIECKGGGEFPSSPSPGQPVVTASLNASSQECYSRAKLTIDAGANTVVYVVDAYLALYGVADSYDTYYYPSGGGALLMSTLVPQDKMEVIAVAAYDNPSLVLYAFQVPVNGCIEPPLPPAEPRPYPTPVIEIKVNCDKQHAKIEVKLMSDLPNNTVNVSVWQAPLMGPNVDGSYSNMSLGRGVNKQSLMLPWSVRFAPIFVDVWDRYGQVSPSQLLLPKGNCKLDYNPADIDPSYPGGK